ncbi:hypothetical protein BJX66DRAFT_304131 [Aspergillus keveii]|uniref:Uncharacterized protein n=1 Tax=Aspergillus keveii TaxID=714993 RepID=A0ABR4G5R8_9EURO
MIMPNMPCKTTLRLNNRKCQLYFRCRAKLQLNVAVFSYMFFFPMLHRYQPYIYDYEIFTLIYHLFYARTFIMLPRSGGASID